MKQAKEDWRLISLENLKKDLVTIKIAIKQSSGSDRLSTIDLS